MKKTTVAILLPTRGRAEQASRRVRELLAQSLPDNVTLLLVVAAEETDRETATAFESLSNEYPDVELIVLTRPEGTTSVQGWNLAYAAARMLGADWVVLGADDVEWLPGWLETALETAERTGAKLVGLLDGHDKKRRYGPHYMAQVSFCEQYLGGVIAVPHYKSWSFDYEACERADMVGLYAPTPRPVIEHHHPDWGLSQMDDTYRTAWPLHEADRALRLERRAAGYPIDYDPATVEGKMRKAPENKMRPASDNKAGDGGAPTVDATPAALKVLEDAGIDPATVKGTGAGGRITKADAEAAVAERE